MEANKMQENSIKGKMNRKIKIIWMGSQIINQINNKATVVGIYNNQQKRT